MNSNETSCLLCGNSAELKLNGYPGYQEPYTFRIYHCSNCNTAFPLPKVDASALYEYIYNNAGNVPGYNRYHRYARFIKKFANPFEYLAESAEPYWGVKQALSESAPEKKLRILEVGSGLGYLTWSLVKADYDATGMEVSHTAVQRAKEAFGDHYICADLFDYASVYKESFDIVILTEVIEHVDDPLVFIAAIMKLLRSEGKIIITTPNKSFFPEDIIWASDLPPVHCWWFSEESMIYIANNLNLNIRFINYDKFYRKNYKVVGLKSQRNGHLPAPFFNSKGELITEAARSKRNLKLHLQVFIHKLPYGSLILGTIKGVLKKILGKSRQLFENDIIVCGEKGIVLCAVMQKRSSA
jgi:SAM-dependent methyltransferase